MSGVFVHGHHYVSWQWWVTVKFRWYPLPGRKFELPILTYHWWPHPLPPPPWTPSRTHTGTVILSAPMDTIVSYTFSSTIQYNSSFFFIFSIFFSLKMWFDVTHPDEGTSWNGQVLNVTNTVSFMTAIISTSGRLHSEFVRLLFLKAHRETDRFFASSGVPTVVSSTSVTRLSLHISKAGLTWLFSLRLQFYVLLLI
jgi:hypothetical protein